MNAEGLHCRHIPKNKNSINFLLDGKAAKVHERNFHKCHSNESFSQYQCVEVTLLFSAVAQRL